MALVGVELETLVSEPDELTTRPPQFEKFLKLKTIPGIVCEIKFNKKNFITELCCFETTGKQLVFRKTPNVRTKLDNYMTKT